MNGDLIKLRVNIKSNLYGMFVMFVFLFFFFQDTLIEKLRLKNSTLKVQKKKLHLQLKQVKKFLLERICTYDLRPYLNYIMTFLLDF